MMDNCCAPQWADFMHSPQMFCEDYFEKEHEVHEPQIHMKCIKKYNFPTPSKDVHDESNNETKFDDSLEDKPPVNTAYFIPHDPKKENMRKESLLRNLKLNEKSNKIHQTWSVSITELTSTFKVSTAEDKNKPMLPERIRKRLMEPRKIQPRNVKKDNLQGKKQAETDIPEEKLSDKTAPKTDNNLKKRRSFGRSQPKVLTCQYRRKSLLNSTRSNKFVSLAEAVSKYQNGTPQRFRTLSNKPANPLMRIKRSSMKLTLPVSPALRCKKRTRQTTVLSQEEREKQQIEELKKNQIKAKPVPVNILKGPSVLKKVPKKPPTIAEEFHFSQPRKKTNEDKDQGNTGPVTHSMSATNVVEDKDDSEPISKRTRQSLHASVKEKSNNKEQKDDAITRSTSSSNVTLRKANICTDSPGKKTRHTVLHVNVQDNKKEQKASAPVARSTSASNVIAKKENICTDSPGKKTRHTLPVQENKKDPKTSATVTRSTSASNVIIRKENICTESPGKKTRHTLHSQDNKKEQKAPVVRSTSASNVIAKKENSNTNSSDRKTRQTSLQEINEKIKKGGVSVTRSISASNIKKTNACTDLSVKKTRHAVLHKSLQEKQQKKGVPIVRSVSASSINRKKETGESSKCNFEARNKEFQAKKEEKLKNLQEMNKIKAEFHARPAPKFARLPFAVKETKKKPVITTCPFSFEQRNKNLAKKKEELVKQKQDEATKTYVFHANPTPNFKPVTVHGWSKENLRNKEKDTKEPAKRAKSCSDQENRQPNVMINANKRPETKSANKLQNNKAVKNNADTDKLKVAKFELKTDKRAKNRTEFDEKLKKKEQEMAMKKFEEEKNRLLQEKMEIAEIRRMMETKARPMPVYKPMVAVKSMKPPTSPHSPALGVRNRAKSAS
ncbi:probable replication factor C subunit 1 [Ceratina calcarata]|uniref:Probable replication factor C subunit 1 n=1 Tax=Ceratina calcarata TaxID=156304 RepID=A0AAJ7S0S1_9HYME|nr:probable replication factor C subunit 1 [Ceratina calcarata]XP_026669293.1 probable replication factor C subunit 1 [Ceratina calcarata]XP_026669294.1 probable replication factor C subunit 1 [Ceratina calcarata]XP_026669295.1 probable replication factor C subunit 1 [Ceratina calcarata]XP_026669296.1 probable replication factor C subunit 1 [Ceratina calcarata]XP_026669297.1 probable replication factor C subunit 1 [Ceratina calcarata]XP_026669298.1 probable replication factor C subunit 1 [Cer